jgi:hypothetical protein
MRIECLYSGIYRPGRAHGTAQNRGEEVRKTRPPYLSHHRLSEGGSFALASEGGIDHFTTTPI